jgi:hypothetical protein
MKKPKPLPYSHPLDVGLVHSVTHVRLVPDEAARKAIAKEYALHSADAFEALLEVNPLANGIFRITGQLKAKVQPLCVVTLEPFPQNIDDAVAVDFASEDVIARLTKRAEENEVEDFEPPDPIIDGVIDLGQVACEFLALSLDPYPKKPGAQFAGLGEEEPILSPFAALKALKGE